MKMSTVIVVLVLVQGLVGCGNRAPVSPTAPTTTTTPTAPPTAVVTSISPNVGSTGGATEVKIIGTTLGATVTFGGVAVQGRFDSRYPGALMILYTPAHAAGTVDVTVSGQNGQSVTLAGAYTYASPQTFDFNGDWLGFGNNGQDTPIRFTIQNNMLLTVSCQSVTSAPDTTVTFSPPRPMTTSEFSFVGDDGVRFSGRIVSPSSATGTITLGECESDAWYASKQ